MGRILTDPPHLVERPRQVSQMRETQREVVARRRVGRVPGDELAVFLHALLIVAGDVVEEAARAVPLALGHAVEVAERLLDVLLGVLLLVEFRDTMAMPA